VNRDLTPSEGARLLLEREREREGEARADYRAAIYTPDATYEGRAVLGEDGSVVLTVEGAPDELADALRMLAKLTARAASKKREDGLPPWPARVLRWRGPGRGE
jgi:hypothetical protein